MIKPKFQKGLENLAIELVVPYVLTPTSLLVDFDTLWTSALIYTDIFWTSNLMVLAIGDPYSIVIGAC